MRLVRCAGFVALVVLAGCASSPAPTEADVASTGLRGAWEGVFAASTTDSDNRPVSFPVDMRLVVDGESARVFTRNSATHPWEEQGLPGPFEVRALGTNAIVFQNRAGRIPVVNGGRWYETYLLVVTSASPDRLLVHWLRAVNNVDTALDDPDRAGFASGEGALLRKSP
jgi:hypothetical protein